MQHIHYTYTLGPLEYKLHGHLLTYGGEDTVNRIKSNWKRYLDDFFILYDESFENLEISHEIDVT